MRIELAIPRDKELGFASTYPQANTVVNCQFAAVAALALVGFAPMVFASYPSPLEQSPRAPVSKAVAFNRCIDLAEPPSWTDSPHHSCTVEWSVLGSEGKAVLYRARYRWPSD